MVNETGVLGILKELLEVPLKGTVAEPVRRCAFGANGGAPDLVQGSDSLLRGETRSADASFKSVEDGAAALDRDLVECGKGANEAETRFGHLRNDGDGDARKLGGGNAAVFYAFPEGAEDRQVLSLRMRKWRTWKPSGALVVWWSKADARSCAGVRGGSASNFG